MKCANCGKDRREHINNKWCYECMESRDNEPYGKDRFNLKLKEFEDLKQKLNLGEGE